jgi:hypothetical protein
MHLRLYRQLVFPQRLHSNSCDASSSSFFIRRIHRVLAGIFACFPLPLESLRRLRVLEWWVDPLVTQGHAGALGPCPRLQALPIRAMTSRVARKHVHAVVFLFGLGQWLSVVSVDAFVEIAEVRSLLRIHSCAGRCSHGHRVPSWSVRPPRIARCRASSNPRGGDARHRARQALRGCVPPRDRSRWSRPPACTRNIFSRAGHAATIESR